MARQKISDPLALACFLIVMVTAVSAAPLSPTGGNAPAAGAGNAYSTRFFIPSEGSVNSAQINTLVNGPGGDVIFGTSFGLSTYNGSWETRHIDRANFSEGLLNDYITAAEFDNRGNLWIGYAGGLQIFNGKTYLTIRDQQLLKDPRVTVLRRWDDTMWIATGNAAVHRYRDGNWTWFQPMTDSGPGFFTVTGMVIDPAADSLVISTATEGEWLVRSHDDPVVFERLSSGEDTFHPLSEVRRDPLGGAYFFNASTVVHYAAGSGFTTALTAADLGAASLTINDFAAGPDGKFYIATDAGIYIWDDGSVYRHVSSFEGIGPSPVVKSIFIDAEGRVWFGTQDYIGYYQDNTAQNTLLPVMTVTPVPVTTVPPAAITASETPLPVSTAQAGPTPPASVQDLLSSIIDPIARAVNAVLGKITGNGA